MKHQPDCQPKDVEGNTADWNSYFFGLEFSEVSQQPQEFRKSNVNMELTSLGDWGIRNWQGPCQTCNGPQLASLPVFKATGSCKGLRGW